MTEISTYMHEDPIKTDYVKDPLKYWFKKTGDRFARMALDFMSAPGKLRRPSSFHNANAVCSHLHRRQTHIFQGESDGFEAPSLPLQ